MSLLNLRDSRSMVSVVSTLSVDHDGESTSHLKRPSIDRLTMDRQPSSDSDFSNMASPLSARTRSSRRLININTGSVTGDSSDEGTEFTDTTVMSSGDPSVVMNSNSNSNTNINVNGSKLNKLNQRFTIYDKSGKSEATIDSFGATLLSWKVNEYGGEQMFVSKLSHFDNCQPIRGGIPIVFPQFAFNGPMPLHGFARVLPWRIKEGSLNYDIDGKNDFITFEYSNMKDKKYNLLNNDPWNWKHRFKLEYSVRLSDYSMYNTLIVSNLDENEDSKTFKFNVAFHNYFGVTNINNVSITGLQHVPFYDKVTKNVNNDIRIIGAQDIKIDRETDRIYTNCHKNAKDQKIYLMDSDRNYKILIKMQDPLKDAS